MKKEEYNTKYNSCDFEINNDNNKINYNIYFFITFLCTTLYTKRIELLMKKIQLLYFNNLVHW